MPREPDPLAELLEGLWRWGTRRALPALREALRAETRRWEGRTEGDPAAARVHGVFRTLLEMVEELSPPSSPAPEQEPRATSEAKEVRSRPGAKLTRRPGRWNTRAQ